MAAWGTLSTWVKEAELNARLRSDGLTPGAAGHRHVRRCGAGQGCATMTPVGWDRVATIVVTVVLAALAGVVYNNRRFDDVNRRFDDVHRRIDDLRADMNARFAQVDARLGELREDLREIRGLLQEALRARAG